MSDDWLSHLDLGIGRWTVLLHSPDSSWWVTAESGVVQASPFAEGECDVGLPAGEPFEVIAFNGNGLQKRWVRGRGSASSSHMEHSRECTACIESQLLLWGTAEKTAQGWTVMAEPRIGRYPVPVSVQKGERVVLTMHELLAKDDHGNVSVRQTVYRGLGALSTGQV